MASVLRSWQTTRSPAARRRVTGDGGALRRHVKAGRVPAALEQREQIAAASAPHDEHAIAGPEDAPIDVLLPREEAGLDVAFGRELLVLSPLALNRALQLVQPAAPGGGVLGGGGGRRGGASAGVEQPV